MNGQLAFFVHDASTLAKNFCGTNTPAGLPEDVGFENDAGGAPRIERHDFLDEGGNVNVRRAGLGAGRVEAVETAGRFDSSLARVVGRSDVSEVLLVLIEGQFGCGFAKGHVRLRKGLF